MLACLFLFYQKEAVLKENKALEAKVISLEEVARHNAEAAMTLKAVYDEKMKALAKQTANNHKLRKEAADAKTKIMQYAAGDDGPVSAILRDSLSRMQQQHN
jgi:hypothetical protein